MRPTTRQELEDRDTLDHPILVVDDEPDIREAIGCYLEAKELEAVCAESGQTALELFRSRHPHVVVTDVRMPGMGGIELLEAIKAERPTTAVIVMTAFAGERSAIDVLRAGAAYYLRKPFPLAELERLIRKCLSWFEPDPVSDLAYFYLQTENLEFEIPNDLAAIAPVVQLLWQRARRDIGDGQAVPFRCGLEEMLINAVEHGNLGISFEEKANALEKERYWALLKERSEHPAYESRRVRLSYRRLDREIRCVINDEGQGFNWRAWFAGTDVQELPQANGRGIFLAAIHADEVVYNDRGNEVTLVWRLED